MPQPTPNANADRPRRLLDVLASTGPEDLGSTMLRLAHMAAAQHRAQVAPQQVRPWTGLTEVDHDSKDKAGHGSPSVSRSARDSGPVTTEGDR